MGDEREITVSGQQQILCSTGTPDVEMDEDGALQIYPTGVADGALVMFTSVDDWRALNAAVEAAIAGRSEANRSEANGGVIPLKRKT
jgi:hypothetical protein